MDSIKLGSGDNNIGQVVDHEKSDENELTTVKYENQEEDDTNTNIILNEVTPQVIDDNEAKLKDRIAQCRNLIESLKIELNEEKSKLETQNRSSQQRVIEAPGKSNTSNYVSTSNSFLEEISFTSGMYSDSVDSKLSCDENLIEYEKQLQKYQNTLNMAQIEKKNAIRKQMLAKAYKLKLLEVENQCNIELLRVKQSLQCLEPLQMIASKWKSGTDNANDVNSYELIPRYPELNATSGCDINSCLTALDIKTTFENEAVVKDDSLSPD